uniref:BEN domain-containing protein n=1 Tax=Trichogramma kaykai TaxID=54128 RepID=A0ABD2WCI4_9HYME
MPVTHARIKFADGMLKTVPIEEIIEFKGNIPKTITSFNNRHFYNIVWKDEKNPDGVKLPILVGKLACGDEEAAKLEKKRISFPSITYSDLDQLSAEHSSAEAIVDVKESKLKKKTQKAQVHKAKLEAAGQVMEKLQKKKSSTARRRLIMDSSDESDESQEKSPSTHKCLRIDSSDETNLSQENNEVLPVKANASINSDELSDKEGRDINVKMHEKPSTAAVNETPGCSTSNASHSNENIETNFRDEQNEHGVAHDDDQAQKDLELILADSESSDEDDSISGKLPQNHLIENGNEQGEIRENGNEQGEIRENGNEEGDIREDGNEEGDIRENGNERGVIRENGNEHGDIRENGNERGVIRENGNEHGNIRENYNEEDPPIRQDRPRDWVLYIPRRRAQQYNLLDEQNLVHQVPIPDGGLDVPREVARNLSFLEEFDNKVYLGCSKAVDRDTWDFISSRSIWVYVRDCAGCLWSINQLVNRCIDRKRTIIQLQGRSPRKQLSPNKHRVLKELLNHYIELRPALEGKKQKLLKQMNKHVGYKIRDLIHANYEKI